MSSSSKGERRLRREQERAAARRPGTPPPREEPGRPGASAVLPESAPARRPRWLLPVALAAALAVVAAVVVAVVTRGGQQDDVPASAGDASAGTATVLVGLEQDGQLTGASLLAVGEEETSALLVPSRLLVDVAGGGRVPLAESVAVSAKAPGDAVADALGLRVDGSWLLGADGLSGLVDAVGGVGVDVDAEVRAGGVTVPVGAGRQLTGEQAVAYATHLEDGEAEATRLARQDQVLSALVTALPEDRAEVAALLQDAAGSSRSTLPEDALVDLLVTASAHLADGSYGATVLPVTDIAAGGEEVLHGLDDAAAAEVLESRFADVRREDGAEAPRVLVQNGIGTPGLGERARDRLVDAGLRFVGGGNAPTLGRSTSAVLVPSGGDADRETGLAVAEALGLPPDVVAVGQEAPTTADVVVVLGADFAELAEPTP